MSAAAGGPPKPERPQQFYINEHWDHCLDLTLRRVVYGGLAAGVAGLVLFRASPLAALLTHWSPAMLLTCQLELRPLSVTNHDSVRMRGVAGQ